MLIDPSMTKGEIRDHLLRLAAENKKDLSRSQASKLADRYKRGHRDPALARAISYADRTGENATYNLIHRGDEDFTPRYF